MLRLASAGCRVLYCDTDSVIYQGEGPRYVLSARNPGEFEARGEFKLAWIEGKKEYALRDSRGHWEPHIKGIPRAQRMHYLGTGRATFDRPVKMREAGRLKLQANVWRSVTKRRGAINRGRVKGSDGTLRTVRLRAEDFRNG